MECWDFTGFGGIAQHMRACYVVAVLVLDLVLMLLANNNCFKSDALCLIPGCRQWCILLPAVA